MWFCTAALYVAPLALPGRAEGGATERDMRVLSRRADQRSARQSATCPKLSES